ncbi:hypothetical protein QZH41_006245 [Actinostola sp. cb2023]|nr:hypothetical protein QZH41_006245 [Actinostola sp. cb2023]
MTQRNLTLFDEGGLKYGPYEDSQPNLDTNITYVKVTVTGGIWILYDRVQYNTSISGGGSSDIVVIKNPVESMSLTESFNPGSLRRCEDNRDSCTVFEHNNYGGKSGQYTEACFDVSSAFPSNNPVGASSMIIWPNKDWELFTKANFQGGTMSTENAKMYPVCNLLNILYFCCRICCAMNVTIHVAVRTAFSLVTVTGVIGNILVCLVVLLNKPMRTPMNYLLVNLAISDMMLLVFFSPTFIFRDVYTHPVGLTGDVLCVLLTGESFAWMGGYASACFLVAIAIERHYAVTKPYHHGSSITRKKLKILVARSSSTEGTYPGSCPGVDEASRPPGCFPTNHVV